MYKYPSKGSQAFTGTAASATLTGQASEIYLCSTKACLFEFDGTASSASTYLPGDAPICIPCNHPSTLGVIQSASAGTLYILEFI